MNQEDDAVLPDDKSITIYYKPNDSSWKTPKVHYGLGDDWNQPEADMKLDAQGYYRATIDTKGKKIDFVFHDADTDQWEHPKDGGNYHANAGITHMGVADQSATVGNPESIGGQTRLVVHYKPASASDNRGVYVWGKDAGGTDINAENHAFTGIDCWGKIATLTFDGKFENFGFIITTNDWNKYGGDRSAKVNADGTAEVWIDGTKYPDQGESTTVETLDAAPADYKCTAATVKVKVHYNRDDGLYFNSEDTSTTVPQWDIWTWSSNWNAGPPPSPPMTIGAKSRNTPSPTTPTTTTRVPPTSACCVVTARMRGRPRTRTTAITRSRRVPWHSTAPMAMPPPPPKCGCSTAMRRCTPHVRPSALP